MDRQQRLQRPPCPSLQTSSQTPSAFHSYSNFSSVSPQGPLHSPAMPTRQTSSAPLPSPTVSHQAHYFASIHPQHAQQQNQGQTQQIQHHTAQQSQPYAQQYAQQLEQHQHPQTQRQQLAQNMSSYNYEPDRTGAGQTAQETARYLGDLGLVAEAAKRAQMAVLMRDMEGVELR